MYHMDMDDEYQVPNGSRSRAMTSRSHPGSSRFPPLNQNPTVARPPTQNSFFDLTTRFGSLLGSPRSGQGQFIQRSSSEECLKCMLKVPHQRCESHKYIRVGGGYRHSFWYVKALLEEIELRRQQEMVRQQRLEDIHETKVRAVKTYIRTKSGRLEERVVFLSEEDYQAFKAGGRDAAANILKKYLSKDEAKGLHKWDKEEQKAITTYIRTKSGRRIAKTVYVNKSDYDSIKRGDVDANAILKKYVKPGEGETVEGWGEAEMKTLKTFIRTNSGRLVEKTILISSEDYDALERIKAAGGDPSLLLQKYMTMDEGSMIESWAKKESKPMNVVKAFVRTKSGRLVEKTVLMTAEEYEEFQASGGDVSLLKKYMDIGKDDVIEDWEKASTVYSASDDEAVERAAPGTRVLGKDGTIYEVVVDEVTGKKYKRKVKDTKKKGQGIAEDPNEKGMSEQQKEQYRTGKRRDGSDSEFSYTSNVSAGGTRHVQRRRKRGDGTYSSAHSYHSDQDEEGTKRRQARRTKRKKEAVKEKKKALAAGKRNDGSDSDYSYKSVVSDGGTRHVTRRKKLAGGKRGKTEAYDSDQDEAGKKRRQRRRKTRAEKITKGGRDADSDGSAYSYRSLVSAGGTRHVTRRKKMAGGARGDAEEYDSDKDEEGKKRRQARRKQKGEKIKKGGRDVNSAGSMYSYRSVVSAGGTRTVKRWKKNADGTHGEEEDYNSADDEEGKKRRQSRRTRREKKQKETLAKGGRNDGSDSDFSYKSAVSAGGTRTMKRRKKNADGTRGKFEEYNSDDDKEGKERRKNRRKKRKAKLVKGDRNEDSDSDFSYRSVHSAGGTRHVKRRKKNADGTYGEEMDYNSDKDEAGKARRKKRRQERHKAEKAGKRNENSDSDFSYRSVHSAGGTRHVKRRRKNADGTYEEEESYDSSEDEDGKARRRRRRRERKHIGSANSYYSEVSVGGTRKVMRKRRRADGTYSAAHSYHSSGSEDAMHKGKKGKKKRPPREHGDDSDYSYKSEVSARGTRRRKRVLRVRDKDGKVVGHGKEEAYTSDSDMEFVDDGKGGKKKVKKIKPVFEGSLASTDSDDEPDLRKMTKAEKEKYLKDKAKRKAEREKRRKEKYGDEYSDMLEQHKSNKEVKKAAKSQVHYQKGSDRFKEEKNEQEIGLSHDSWGNKNRKGRKGKAGDGHDADDEEEDGGEDGPGGRRKKKKGGKGGDSDEESIYEYARDEKGSIIRDKDGKPIMKKVGTKKKGANRHHREGVIDSDSDYEYIKDRRGNVVRKKKGVDEESDGDYFEVDAQGQVHLRKGKRKIDLSKLSHEDLKKLGLDPEKMTKEEIARILKAKFGDGITIIKAGKKVGLKGIEDYAGANTDELADDSDFDTSTLKGQRRVRVLMRKGGQQIIEHMKQVITTSDLVDEAHTHPDERDNSIDFLNHYRLVDGTKVDMYARAFVVEDDDFDSVVNVREATQALDGVPTIQSISKKQMAYIQKLLDIDKETHVTFRMFSVMTALAERVTAMDSYCKHLLEISDLMDIHRKMDLFKSIFYCNVRGDRDPNYIKAESLRIELIAGGLNRQQQDYVMEKMAPNKWNEVSFFDYLCYVPLFMSMHDKMVENPLDMSNAKYVPSDSRPPSPLQRDNNPLGFPLRRTSMFITRQTKNKDLFMKTDDLLSARMDRSTGSQENLDLYKKYTKLPSIKRTKTDPIPMRGEKANL